MYSPARVDGTACVGWYFVPRTDSPEGVGAGVLKYIPLILTFFGFWNIDKLRRTDICQVRNKNA